MWDLEFRLCFFSGAWCPVLLRAHPIPGSNRTNAYASKAVTGIVKIHAHTIRSTTVHLIAFKRRAAPTPMMAAEILCVVETGMPRRLAARMTVAELVSA